MKILYHLLFTFVITPVILFAQQGTTPAATPVQNLTESTPIPRALNTIYFELEAMNFGGTFNYERIVNDNIALRIGILPMIVLNNASISVSYLLRFGKQWYV